MVSEPVPGTGATEASVVARARWNAPETRAIPLSVLYGWQFRDEAGGICRASPRAFLHAHVWCDHVGGSALGHVCGVDPPHELTVCILPTDNPPETYARAASLARARQAR